MHRLAAAPPTLPLSLGITENSRDFDVGVDPVVTTDDMGMMIRMACAGAGITFGMADTFRSCIARGELVPLLEAFCPPLPGFYLYYPKRQRQPLKLSALVDYVRKSNSL